MTWWLVCDCGISSFQYEIDARLGWSDHVAHDPNVFVEAG